MAPRRGIQATLRISACWVILTLAAAAGRLAAARPAENDYFELLKGKFDLARDNYAKALPEELILFRGLYPQSSKLDSVEYMLAVLYDQNGQESEALANFLKIMYVCPSSERTPEVLAHLRRLASEQKRGITSLFADDNFKMLKKHVLQMTGEPPSPGGGERGYFDFIQLLADARVESLARYLADECVHYLYHLDYNFQADRVLVIRGDMFRLLKDYQNAILSYSEAPLLVPLGQALPLALLRTGEVYFRDLSDHGMARNLYQQTIDKYPASLEAARASIFLSEVEESEKNYGEAITRLETTAARFPFAETKMECNARMGRIYQENLDSPEKAVAAYQRTVDEYSHEPRATEALLKIGGIYEKNKDFKYAVDTYRRLAELFPDNPLTPEYLLRAAELADGKLKDRALATELYTAVAGRYPDSDPGRKAAKKIGK